MAGSDSGAQCAAAVSLYINCMGPDKTYPAFFGEVSNIINTAGPTCTGVLASLRATAGALRSYAHALCDLGVQHRTPYL